MAHLVWNRSESAAVPLERLDRLLAPLGGMESVVRPGDTVLIKPNFVAPFPHAVTAFDILSAIINMVRNCGGKPIIGESSGFEFETETTFNILGAYSFARRHKVPLINFDRTEFATVALGHGINQKVRIPRLVLEADRLINVPKLKRHSLTKATVGVKNLFGLLSRKSRRKIHAWGLEKTIHALGERISCDLVVVDGSVVTTRAVFGEQTRLNLITASKSVHAVDVFCCQYLGLDYRDVEHIRRAVEMNPHRERFKVLEVLENCRLPEAAITFRSSDIPRWNDTAGKILHRRIYQLIYLIDIVYSRMNGGRSMIPSIHYYFGIRPFIRRAQCDACGKCAEVCPVNAIALPQRRIIRDRCMPVRCLKCLYVCPLDAIGIKGRDVDPSLMQQNTV